jgi:hypothetical protein
VRSAEARDAARRKIAVRRKVKRRMKSMYAIVPS